MENKKPALALAKGLYNGFLFAVIGAADHHAGCKKVAAFVAGAAFIEAVNGINAYRSLKKEGEKIKHNSLYR